jgi:hypothetical protein
VQRLRRQGRDEAAHGRKETGAREERGRRALLVLADAGAGRGAAREEGSVAAPAPTADRSQIPSRAPGTLLFSRGRALEVTLAEAPLVVQRSRCPGRLPQEERGKGAGEREVSWGGVATTTWAHP